MSARPFSPESSYLLWCGCWVVAGAALLWRRRAALRRDTDGRTGWTGATSALAAYFGLYVGLQLALTGLGTALARELAKLLAPREGRELALAATLIPALLAGALLFIRRHVPEITPARPRRVTPPGPFGFTPAGLLNGYAGAMALVNVTAVLWALALAGCGLTRHAELQELVRLLAGSGDPVVFAGIALGAVVFAPVHEELFFRSGLFAALRARMPRHAAYALSGLLFAAVHFNLNGLLPLAVLGAWLAWLYDTTADLRVPIVVHALFNAGTVVWLYIAPRAAG